MVQKGRQSTNVGKSLPLGAWPSLSRRTLTLSPMNSDRRNVENQRKKSSDLPFSLFLSPFLLFLLIFSSIDPLFIGWTYPHGMHAPCHVCIMPCVTHMACIHLWVTHSFGFLFASKIVKNPTISEFNEIHLSN